MAKYSHKRRIGNVGEEIACRFLARKGYTIVERNYLQVWGEADIIAEKGGVVSFIEVKSAQWTEGLSREKPPNPEELVTREKLKKLARTAALYMEEKGDQREYQIDVVSVLMDTASRRAQCRLYEQVLEGDA